MADNLATDVSTMYLLSPEDFHLRTIIVKNLPDEERLDLETFTNFMESKVNIEVEKIHITKKIAMVLFEEEIQGKAAILSKVQRKKLYNETLEFIFPGQPSGILIRGNSELPEGKLLSLYFSRPSNLGEEPTGILVPSKDPSMAVLKFDAHFVQGLPTLIQGQHKVTECHLQIEPYIEEFHNLIIQNLIQKNTGKSVVQECIDSKPGELNDDDDDDDDDDHSDDGDDDSDNDDEDKDEDHDDDEDGCVYLNDLNNIPNLGLNDRSGGESKIKQTRKLEVGEGVQESKSSPKQMETLACKAKLLTREHVMERGKLVMLRFHGFAKKCKSCEVDLDIGNNKVIFHGETEEVLKEGYVQMLSVVVKIQDHSENISLNLHKILSRKEGQNFMRTTLKNEKLRAFVDVADNNHIQSLAFKQKEAINATEAITSKMTKREIQYTKEHIDIINSTTWTNSVSAYEKDKKLILVQIVKKEFKVVIEGLASNVVLVANDLQKLITSAEVQRQHISGAHMHQQAIYTPKGNWTGEVGQTQCIQRAPVQQHKPVDQWPGEVGQTQYIQRAPVQQHKPVDQWPGEVGQMQDKPRAPVQQHKPADQWTKVDLRRIAPKDYELAILSFHLLSKGIRDFIEEFERQHSCKLKVVPGQETVPWPLSKSAPAIPGMKSERGGQPKTSTKPTELKRYKTASSLSSRHTSLSSLPSQQFSRPYSASPHPPPSSRPYSALPLFPPSSRPYSATPFPQPSSRPYSALPHSPPSFRPSGIQPPFQPPQPSLQPYSTLEAKTDAPSSGPTEFTNSITVNRTVISVEQNTVVKCKSDILVNFFKNNAGMMEGGYICNAFLKGAGEDLMQYIDVAWDKSTGVFITSPGNLSDKCSNVFHVVLDVYSGPGSHQEFQEAIKQCFIFAKMINAKSIGLPAVGCGRLLRYPPDLVSSVLISEAKLAAQSNSCLQTVKFVALDEDIVFKFMEGLQAEYSTQVSLSRPLAVDPPSVAGLHVDADIPMLTDSTDSDDLSVCNDNVSASRTSTFSPKRGSYKRYTRETKTTRKDHVSHKSTPKSPEHENQETIPVAVVTISAKKGGHLRGTFSRKAKERFLSTRTIEVPSIQHLNHQRRTFIRETCSKENVYVTIHKGQGKIELKGAASDVTKSSEAIYKYLLTEKSTVGTTEQNKTSKKQYPPGSQRYTEDPPVPSYWKYFKAGRSVLDEVRRLVGKPRIEQHSVDQKTFEAIAHLVEKTFDDTHTGHGKDARNLTHQKLVVKKVEIIENLELYEKYAIARQRLFRKLAHSKSNKLTALENVSNGHKKLAQKGPLLTAKHLPPRLSKDVYSDINEYYFFHGTKDEYIENITAKGLDPRNGDDAGMFGAGIYAAESSTKADQYADSANNRTNRNKKMFLVRLLMGDMFVTSTPMKYKKPPCSKCLNTKCVKASHELFDSVVGDGSWLFREFVVYKAEHCYPEYLITYDRSDVKASHELFDSVVGDGSWLFREFVVNKAEHCYPEYLITYDRYQMTVATYP